MKIKYLNRKLSGALTELEKELLNKKMTLEEIDNIVFEILYKRDFVEIRLDNMNEFKDLGYYRFFIDKDWIEKDKNEFVFVFEFAVEREDDEWETVGYCLRYKTKDIDLIVDENKYGIKLNKDTVTTVVDIFTI